MIKFYLIIIFSLLTKAQDDGDDSTLPSILECVNSLRGQVSSNLTKINQLSNCSTLTLRPVSEDINIIYDENLNVEPSFDLNIDEQQAAQEELFDPPKDEEILSRKPFVSAGVIAHKTHCCPYGIRSSQDNQDDEQEQDLLARLQQWVPIPENLYSAVDEESLTLVVEAEAHIQNLRTLLLFLERYPLAISVWASMRGDEGWIDTSAVTRTDQLDIRHEVEEALKVPGEAWTIDDDFSDIVQNEGLRRERIVEAKDLVLSSEHMITFSFNPPAGVRWVRIGVDMFSTTVCVKMLQVSWKLAAASSRAVELWENIASYSGWAERVVAVPFLILILPYVRRRRRRNVILRSPVVIWGSVRHKFWIAMLYIATSMGLCIHIFNHHDETRDMDDNWIEFYLNLVLAVTLLVEVMVRLPLHLAHACTETSIRANVIGVCMCLLFMLRLPSAFIRAASSKEVPIVDILRAIPYAVAESTNLLYFTGHLIKLLYIRAKGHAKTRQFSGKNTSTLFALPWQVEHTRELFRHRPNLLANTHHMESFKPQAIIRHLLSKRSTFRNLRVPIPLLTACVSTILVVWISTLSVFGGIMENRAKDTCTFSHTLPHANYILAALFGIDNPIELSNVEDFEQYAVRLYHSGTAGAFVSLVVVGVVLFYLLGGILMSFDIDLAKVRRGDYTHIDARVKFTSRSSKLWTASAYMAAQIGFGFFGVWFFSVVVIGLTMQLFMLVTIPGTWDWLLTVVEAFSPIFVAIAIAAVLKLIFRKLFYSYIYIAKTGFWITKPGSFSHLHYFVVPVTLLNSILGFFGRIAAGSVALVMYGMRLDAANQLGALTILDPTAKVYSAYILAEHHYTNPVLRTFLDLARQQSITMSEKELQQIKTDAYNTLTTDISALTSDYSMERSYLHSTFSERSNSAPPVVWNTQHSLLNRRRRARNSWFLAYSLLNNPQLVVERHNGNKFSIPVENMMKAGLLKTGLKRLLQPAKSFREIALTVMDKSKRGSTWEMGPRRSKTT